jgi:hypothetical protein
VFSRGNPAPCTYISDGDSDSDGDGDGDGDNDKNGNCCGDKVMVVVFW